MAGTLQLSFISFFFNKMEYCDLFQQLICSFQQTLLTSARIIKENHGLKEYEEVAIKRLETVVYLGKADHTVYFDLGMLYIRKGQTETAKKYFSEAIKVS